MEPENTMAYQIEAGTTVKSADDEKLGKVVAVDAGYLVVEKGFFFPTDYYVPASAIATYDGDTVYLNVGKDEALHSTWNVAPGTDTVDTATTDRASYGNEPVSDTTRPGQVQPTHLDDNDRLVIPVHEEELAATKRAVDRGQVHIEKDVIEEERTLDVPVMEEQVTVQRRAVDRPVAADAASFEEETIDVPIRGEEVDLQKQTRVTEEVEIAKEAVARTERVAGTVHREEIRIDDDLGQEVSGGVSEVGPDADDNEIGRQRKR